MRQLLSRDEFRQACFERDNHRCVICGQGPHINVAIDAHHILERRLWDDGGYYLDNAATLCDKGERGCHYQAEQTVLSVDDIRRAAGIQKPIIPEDLYSDVVYDKWGNVEMANGLRTRGPMMNDESVRKVIGSAFSIDDLFTWTVKYPRTYHLPWSPGITDDDRVMKDLSVFEGKRVIVTRKMDGENFTGYRDSTHARSVDGRSHYTRNWAKSFWMERSYEIPEGWRVCAENLYATHSIRYDDLPSYLMGFSIWDDRNFCVGWDETVELFDLLDMRMVPVLYDGIWDEKKIQALHTSKDDSTHEGYVVRLAEEFAFGNFKNCVAKYVRKGHVQDQKHWFYGRSDHEINGMRQ